MYLNSKAQIAITTASILWGITPLFVEFALDYLSPLNIMTFRFGIAVIALSVFLPLIKERHGLILLKSKTCILIGWLIAFGYLTSTIGQKMTTPGIATLIPTGYVIIVPFISWKLENTKLNISVLLSAITALIGIFFIAFNGNWANLSSITSFGTVFLISAAFLWGLNIVLAGKLLMSAKLSCDQQVDKLSYLYATLMHTFIPLFLLSILTNPPQLSSLSISMILILIFLGTISTIITNSLYNWALSQMGSVKTTIYLLMQNIIPFLFELIVLRYSYSIWIFSGIVFIFIAMIMVEFYRSSDLRIDNIKNIGELDCKNLL